MSLSFAPRIRADFVKVNLRLFAARGNSRLAIAGLAV
jgi:hypothetical protein